MRNNIIRNILPLLLPVALIGACLGQESGIDNRHILGVAIIPPLDYVEIEAGDESANNTVEGAEFVDFVGYRYVVVQGALVASTDASDTDIYQFTSGLDGDISFTLVWTEDQFTDMDVYQLDVAGGQVAAAEGSLGFETLDVTVEEEGEVFIEVAAKGLAEGYDGSYTLIMRGIEPNEQGEPEDPDYWPGMDPVLVGAYTSGDVDSLGNPVSGTSILEWNDDPETYQHWATFDMYIVQSVEVIADVFVSPELEDGKDNNCDGITDRGLSEADADGDGARVADGDCDDTDATVRPGWPDDAGDGIDGDCDGWADNGLDGVDDDGDGQSEFDGDCNDADPLIYNTLLSEIDMGADLGVELLPDGKDNNCDGTIDNDPGMGDDDDSAGPTEPTWPTDNDGDGWTIADEDCNDADPTIHPCPEGERCFDYRDGKDNDCDALRSALSNDAFDENFEYYCPEGGCSPIESAGEFIQDPAQFDDADGDGFSESLGDCNDTDPDISPGNYELITYHEVSSDIDRVWLWAGSFGSLNAPGVVSGDISMTAPQEVDLSSVPEQVSWEMDEDWMADGGTLVPSGLPQIYIDAMVPPLFGLTYTDLEPNDCADGTPMGQWGSCSQDLPGVISLDGYVDRVLGTFETIVQDSWSGDNDTYHFFANEAGYVNGELDWETESADMDWYLYCYFGNEFNPWNWYIMSSDTVDLTKPETGQSVVPVPAGTECYAWTVGYSGPNGEPYKLKLWMSPAE